MSKLLKTSLTGGFIFGNALSFTGTGIGLGFLLSTAWSGDPLIAYGAAFGASAVLQSLLAGSWQMATNPDESLLRRLIWGAMGCSTTVLSATLATGFWVWSLSLDSEVARLETQAAASGVTAPLREAADRFDTIATEFAALSTRMATQYETEYANGDSCDGPAVAIGEGPRTRLATRLRDEASARKAEARALADRAFDLTVIPQGADDAMLRDLYRDANQMNRAPELASLTTWTRKLKEEFSTQFTDPLRGTVFTCRSADTVAILDQIDLLVSASVTLPIDVPRAVQAGLDTALTSSFSQAWGLIRWAAFGGQPPDAETLSVTRPAMGFAGANEALIILTALLRNMLRPKRSPKAPHGNPMTAEERAALKARLMAWSLLLQPGRTPLFLVPHGGNVEVMQTAIAERNRWGMKPLIDSEHALDFQETEAAEIHAQLLTATGATQFRAYKVPQKATEWYRQATIDLHDSLNPAPVV